MLRRYWQDMTWRDFEGLDSERSVAVLPVGAIEQHGPHLPVCVDACINQGIISRAAELMADDLPVTILPMTSVGKSVEHLQYPGTLTLSAATLAKVWTEIGESVARAGIRKLVFLNSHGGQPQVMEIVARDLRIGCDMLAVATSWYGLGLPDGLFDDAERRHGIHAGAIETSMMLHLRPDLVRMDKAENFQPLMAGMEGDYKRLTALGSVSIGWQIQDLHPSGACGDATNADAERGRLLVDHAATCFVELLDDVVRYPLGNLRDR